MALSIRGSPTLIGGSIFLLVGLSLLGVSVWQIYNDRRFSQEAQPTEGIVVAKQVRTDVRTTGPNTASERTER